MRRFIKEPPFLKAKLVEEKNNNIWKEKYQSLLKNMYAGVAVYQPIDNGRDFIFTDFNPASEIIDKVARSDVLGKKVTEVFPGIESFGLLEVFIRVNRTGIPEHFDINEYKDQRVSFWRDNFVFKTSHGEIVAVYEDMTAKKNTELHLQESLKTLQQINDIINKTNSMIFAWKNNQGNWPIEYVTENVERILGYKVSDFISGQIFYEQIIHPDDLSKISSEVEQIVDGTFKHSLYRIIAANGDIKWVKDHSYPVKDELGNIVSYKGVVEDITEEKQIIDDHNRVAIELERKSKHEAIGIFANKMAHDFNNIIHSVNAFAELAIQNIHNPEKCKNSLNNIIKAAGSAVSAVNQIENTTGIININPADCSLKEIIEDAIQTVEPFVIDSIKISTSIVLDSDIIYVDADLLVLSIINLLKNSIYSMRERTGEIMISARAVCYSDDVNSIDNTDTSMIIIKISDMGEGIGADVIDKIFDPYFSTKGSKDRGLGLSLVYNIITGHDGRIEVDSKQNLGTTFRIFLPDKNTQQVQVSEDCSSKVENCRESMDILIAEDCNIITEFIEEISRAAGFNCNTFVDVTSLINYLESEKRYRYLIIDAGIASEKDIINTVKKVCKNAVTIITSGSKIALDNLQEKITIPNIIYLSKPFTSDQLLEIINRTSN